MLPAPRGIFGVHSVTPYSRVDGTPFGTIKVVNSASLNFSGTTVPLKGGSNKSPWMVEEGEINCSLGLKIGEYPDLAFTLFMGVTPTENAADALGAISTLTNNFGTSVMSATTGISAAAIVTGSEGDVKFGRFVVVAKSTTTVNVYCYSDVDFQRGTQETYQDGTLKLLASDISITASTASAIAGYGFKLTGGSGTIAFVTGDTATFETRPKNTGSFIAMLGQSGAVFPEMGILILGKKRGTGEMVEIDCLRCKAEGFPIGFDADKWSTADIKVQLMYDSVQNGFARQRIVTPISPN